MMYAKFKCHPIWIIIVLSILGGLPYIVYFNIWEPSLTAALINVLVAIPVFTFGIPRFFSTSIPPPDADRAPDPETHP